MTPPSQVAGRPLSAAAAAATLRAWLLGPARAIDDTGDLLAGLAVRLQAVGVPVWRLTVHNRQLHPLLFTRAYYWVDGKGTSQVQRPRDVEGTNFFINSPVARVFAGHGPARYDLEHMVAPREFPLLDDLAADGITHYAIWPLDSSEGTAAMAFTASTRQAGGYGKRALTILDQTLPVVAPLIELIQRRLNAIAILDTYVGHHAGAKVLAGSIHLGDGETIEAVLWYCDIRDFTALSETLQRDALIDTLNGFFECVVDPVQELGGEVLKFVGDAMLAIFPLSGDSRARRTAAQKALDAANAARRRVEEWNTGRAGGGAPQIRFGIALHAGDVMYGNIGGDGRLDFTVIGPAVNRVTRMEKFCSAWNTALVASAEFVALCPTPFQSRGECALRGIARPVELFTPA